MILPTDFQFSQGSLQDYVDCPRRFHLRYVQRLAWPAIDAEPALENERYLQQGAAFHRLAHQHALGIPADRLVVAGSGDDADIRRWWAIRRSCSLPRWAATGSWPATTSSPSTRPRAGGSGR